MRAVQAFLRWWRREEGQTLALAAVGMAGMLAIAALVVDVGRVVSEKQALQNAADAAALAGATELLEGAAAAATTAGTYNALNGIGGDDTSSIATAASSITVTNTRTVSLTFAQVFGVGSHEVTASATATLLQANGFIFDDYNVFPYAVWGGNPGDTLTPGETVTFFSNQYKNANGIEDTNPNWAVPGDNNSFSGYFKHGGEIVYVSGQEQTFASGGSACGHQDALIAALQAKMTSGDPIVLPVVTRAIGNGEDVNFVIAAWVGVRVTQVSCPQAFRGVVLEDVDSPLGYSDGPVPPDTALAPPVYTVTLVD